MILCTKKRSLADALAYVEYVTNTIHNKELFHSIDMRFVKAWDYLLWCDPSNFGGIKSKMSPGMSEKARKGKKPTEEGGGDDDDGDDEAAEEDGTEFSDGDDDDGDDDDEDDGPDIEMNWNLASYLPEEGACQKNFNTVVAGYVMAIHQVCNEIHITIKILCNNISHSSHFSLKIYLSHSTYVFFATPPVPAR